MKMPAGETIKPNKIASKVFHCEENGISRRVTMTVSAIQSFEDKPLRNF